MKERNGKFKDPILEKETVQHEFLRKIAELEPELEVLKSLPLESFSKLNYLKQPDNLKNFIGKENISVNELLSIFLDADPATIERDFADFNQEMIAWADKYALKKDWIFRSAILAMKYHLDRIQRGEQSSINCFALMSRITTNQLVDIEISLKMMPNNETWAEFEKRVREELREKKRIFQEAKTNNKQKTNKFEYLEKVRWLVRYSVQNKSVRWIVENDLKLKPSKIWDDDHKYHQQLKLLPKEIEKLKIYDLPIRKKKKIIPKK